MGKIVCTSCFNIPEIGLYPHKNLGGGVFPLAVQSEKNCS
jgi:hypothetical protein